MSPRSSEIKITKGYFMKHFINLIDMIHKNVTDLKSKSQLSQILHQSIKARELISYCVRIEDFNENDLTQMEKVARELLISSCVFGQRISPSLWTYFDM